MCASIGFFRFTGTYIFYFIHLHFLVECLSMIVWTHTVLGALYACVLYLYLHVFSVPCSLIFLAVRWLLTSMSQQHASVSHRQLGSDKCTCCHTEIEVADQTFYLT